MFGSSSNSTAPSFLFGSGGQNTSSGFGASNASSGGLFGGPAKKTNTGLFGSTPAAPAANGTGFGAQQNDKPGFGAASSGGLFGLKPAGTTGFGATQASTSAPSTPFGSKPQTATSTLTGGLFGAASNPTAAPAAGGLFGSNNTASQQPAQSGGLFGLAKPATGGLFGQSLTAPSAAAPSAGTGGLFGGSSGSGGLFGSNNAAPKPAGLFGLQGAQTTQPSTGGLFGLLNTQSATTGGLFGQQNAQTGTGGGLFGQTNTQNNNTGGLFGGQSTGGLFGGQQQPQQPQQQQQQQAQLTAMTRVGDLPPDVKKELQDFDKYISTQHLIATTLNDDIQKHDQLIKSIPSDVSYLHTKILSIKQALKFDTDQLKSLKSVNDELTEDIGNIMQLIIQLLTPGTRLSSSYHLNEFFIKRIKKYRELLSIYEGVISEGGEAIAGLEKSCNETYGSIADVVQVVRNQYSLFMELCESLAEIHAEVSRLTQ